MKKVVIAVLQSKGGVGKTHISAAVCNALIDLNPKVYDNDSKVPRLKQYQSLKAQHIQLYDLDSNGNTKPESLNINKMDVITDELENGKHDYIIVDNGSPSFEPFLSYFQADAIEMFKLIDVEFVVIIPIGKDPVTHDAPLEVLRSYGSTVKYILVENKHFGEFNYDTTTFETAGVDVALINMERYTRAQLDDVDRATSSNLLLHEAIRNPMFNLISKSRLQSAERAFKTPFLSILNDFLPQQQKDQ